MDESFDASAAPEPARGPDPVAAPSQPGAGRPPAPGSVAFLGQEEIPRACLEFDRRTLLVVRVDDLDGSARGSLGESIDDAVERQLEARGSPGPSVASAGGRDSALSDQLYRARRAGAEGIAVILGSLAAIADPSGALLPADCATLRFLAAAATERPIFLVFHASDARLGGYGDAVPLGDLLAWCVAAQNGGDARRAPAGRDAARNQGLGEKGSATDIPRSPAGTGSDNLARHHTAGASLATSEQAWRNWMLQLSAARGPQPLAALEKLFADSYMPLASALAGGLDDPRARAAHDEFRATFTRSYAEAFPTFAATTKRPRMVLDVHDAAARIARLHGARTTRLLLVDAMRWDLSRLVATRVAVKLGERAALTDELLLWSALPTTTMRQLETIARGVEALRAPAELDAEGEPTRGRTAEYVRRLRVGPREIHKLDLVQARLQSARGAVLRALPEIAEATADVVARHAETLAPHTLLFVFGDHGFAVDRGGSASEGGASPEEVIVGAFALLVGDVH